jgi:uncharacterized membrane protein YphA (DoxX/SURF4 family)
MYAYAKYLPRIPSCAKPLNLLVFARRKQKSNKKIANHDPFVFGMNSDDLLVESDALPKPKNYLSIVRILLGALFVASAVLKLFPIEYFEVILVDQVGLPWNEVPIFSRLLITLEFGLGIALMFGFYTRLSLWLSLGLLAAFQVFLIQQIAIGQGDVDCGCFGELLPLDGKSSVLKNVGLMMMAGLLLFCGRSARQLAFPMLAPAVIVLAIPALFLVAPMPDFDPNADFELDVELLQRVEFDPDISSIEKGNKTVVLMLASCIHCAQLGTLISQLDPTLVENELRLVVIGGQGGVEFFVQETGLAPFEFARSADRELIGAIGGVFPAVLYMENGKVLKKWKGREANISLLTELLRLD